MTNIHCVPAVETAGYVLISCVVFRLTRGFNHGKRFIATNFHCVPAVKTAGYVLISCVVFQYSPWFQPRETVSMNIIFYQINAVLQNHQIHLDHFSLDDVPFNF